MEKLRGHLFYWLGDDVLMFTAMDCSNTVRNKKAVMNTV